MANEKRLIDANAFRDFWNKNYRHQYANDNFLVAIANFPTVDAVGVVRCEKCVHFDIIDGTPYCHYWSRNTEENGFCHNGI